eukprot:TRINITY_DN39699_c0_g3_i1.p1 TRINITY_DN39699_c0_g3~~TRINITY_DN39699_c0_g3_i1.p1  ORF type:complete len:314 (-),score=92.53 TRINITY_DN39699_c0_g3_i1:3472-4386(-)
MGGRGKGKGGKGSWYGGWSQGPYQHWQDRDPLQAMASQIEGALGGAHALGRISQLGLALAGASTPVQAASPGGDNIGAGLPGQTGPMSGALIKALQPNVSPVMQAPQENAGVLTQQAFDSMLSNNKAFSGLSSRVNALEEHATLQTGIVTQIQKQQATDSSVLRDILSHIKGDDGHKKPAAYTPPKAPMGAASAAAEASEVVKLAPDEEAEKYISFARHRWFCEKFSISLDRQLVKFTEFEEDEAHGLVAEDVWLNRVMKAKTVTQWKSKLIGLQGDKDEVAAIKTVQDVVNFIASKMWEDVVA